MAAQSYNIEEQLTCSICLERYTDPRTLPCHHSFCMQCLTCVPVIPVEPGQHELKCPICCKSTQLPEGGVCKLPPAFLINNLLELHDAKVPQNDGVLLSCDKHNRPLEFYCESCEEVICPVCVVRNHHSHQCDLVTEVSEKYKQQMKHQLRLLSEDMAGVEKALGEVGSVTKKVSQEGNTVREDIIHTTEQLHRHVEETKRELIEMLDQTIQQKLDSLAEQHDEVATTLAQMRSYLELAERKLEKPNDQEFLTTTNEMVKRITEVRKHANSAASKCTASNMVLFLANTESVELGVLVEHGIEDQVDLGQMVAGEKYTLLLCVPGIRTAAPSCQLVPYTASVEPTECQVSEVKKGKYQVSFTPCHVGIHQLKIVAGKSSMAVAPIVVNTPTSTSCQERFSQPSGVAVTEEGLVVV